MSNEIPPPVSPPRPNPARRRWPDRAMDYGEELVRRTLATLRPRVSLTSGSAMVLLTLILPVGYQSCGPETKGYELLQGKGDWPTFVGITLSEYFGPLFYGLVLLLAAGTAVLAIVSLSKPALGSVVRRAFILSGVLSLFLLSDVAAILPLVADDLAPAAAGLVVLSCLLPGWFWPKRIFWRWFGLLIVSSAVLAALAALDWVKGDVPAWILLGIWAIYALGPQALWWAHWSGRWKPAEDWTGIRRGMAAFYFPAALGNVWFMFVARTEGVWGFIPCWLGLHLMSLGYLRLAREVEPSSTSAPPVLPLQGAPL